MTTQGTFSTPEDPQVRIDELTAKVEKLEQELAEKAEVIATVGQMSVEEKRQLEAKNAKLIDTLREARAQLLALREEVDRLAQPPSGFGVFRQLHDDGTADISTSGRDMRVALSPNVEADKLAYGQKVRLNEALTVVEALGFDRTGVLLPLQSIVEDDQDRRRRAIVTSTTDEQVLVELAEPISGLKLKSGDLLLVDTKVGYAYERLPKQEVEDLQLEEVPDISYVDIGGLARQIEQIHDAVELPFLYPELFRKYELPPPKGVLLYGPPGCGKTLIAKAVANSLAKRRAEEAAKLDSSINPGEAKAYFINVKGPELLNKFVGETERHIRLIFQRAREKASEGSPVIVFFDEMDSLFRTRGSGVSSDVENTIVPQLLAELDGVEALENVIVIGASNREDMIDPAILRPGRLDVKIKVERPDAEAAKDIFTKYLTPELPLHQDILSWYPDARTATSIMIHDTVEEMYRIGTVDHPYMDNQFLEVTYANGDKEILYFKDFASGAMIRNIVDRAKKAAIKDELADRLRGVVSEGIKKQHLLDAVRDEFHENEDLPNTTNPDDWARISGKKGERIVYIRTLIQGKAEGAGRAIDTVTSVGQYL